MKIREVDVKETKKDVPFVVGGVYYCTAWGQYRLLVRSEGKYALFNLCNGNGIALELVPYDEMKAYLNNSTVPYEYVPDAELVVPTRKERD